MKKKNYTENFLHTCTENKSIHDIQNRSFGKVHTAYSISTLQNTWLFHAYTHFLWMLEEQYLECVICINTTEKQQSASTVLNTRGIIPSRLLTIIAHGLEKGTNTFDTT